jgi:hypothetical protein
MVKMEWTYEDVAVVEVEEVEEVLQSCETIETSEGHENGVDLHRLRVNSSNNESHKDNGERELHRE